MNLFDPVHRAAAARPRHPAIVSRGITVSYRNLVALSGQIAAGLHERGVRPGDVVAMMAYGLLPHVPLSLAVARIGAVSMPLPKDLAPGTRHDIAAACGAKFLVHNEPDADRAVGDGFAGVFSLKELGESALEPPPVAAVPEGGLWRIALSSGTTGRPKPVRCVHEAQVVKSSLFRLLVPSPETERMLVGMGPGVMFATNYWLRALLAGRTLVAADPKPLPQLDAIHEHGATHLVMSPANALSLLEAARKRGGAFLQPAPSMRALVLGGSAVSPALQALLKKHIAPELFINYGATEVGVVAFSDAATQEKDPASAGAVPPWMQVQAVDEDGTVLPAGSAGRLRVRGPGMAAGYVLPGEDAAAGAFDAGWFHSSDVGVVTPDGLVYLRGRGNEVINLGGTKVDPAEVEAILTREGPVTECGVFAAPGRSGQPRLAAAVVLSGPVAAGELRERCLRELGQHSTPELFVAVTALPRNDAGKLMRDQLAACARDGQAI